MTTAVTRTEEGSRSSVVLHLALELSEKKWILAFTTGLGQKPRQVTIPASDLIRLAREVEAAKRRFRLAGDVGVVSCYEAGLEGFWLHRALEQMGLENVVVDSASIDVKRRRTDWTGRRW
jgi:transposase